MHQALCFELPPPTLFSLTDEQQLTTAIKTQYGVETLTLEAWQTVINVIRYTVIRQVGKGISHSYVLQAGYHRGNRLSGVHDNKVIQSGENRKNKTGRYGIRGSRKPFRVDY